VHEEPIVGADWLTLAQDPRVDQLRRAVVETRADIQRVAIVEDVHLAALARRIELDGVDLMEVVDDGGALPDFLGEIPVDDGRLGRSLDAYAFRLLGRGLRVRGDCDQRGADCRDGAAPGARRAAER
jgi:hypothetical protein